MTRLMMAASLIASGCATSLGPPPPPAPAPALVQDDPDWREHTTDEWWLGQCWEDITYRCVAATASQEAVDRCLTWDGGAPAPVDAGCAW